MIEQFKVDQFGVVISGKLDRYVDQLLDLKPDIVQVSFHIYSLWKLVIDLMRGLVLEGNVHVEKWKCMICMVRRIFQIPKRSFYL